MYHMNIIRKQCKADSLPNHKQTHMLCRLYYHIKRNTLQSKVTTKQQIYIHYNILCRQCKEKSVELCSRSTNVPQNIIRRHYKTKSLPNMKLHVFIHTPQAVQGKVSRTLHTSALRHASSCTCNSFSSKQCSSSKLCNRRQQNSRSSSSNRSSHRMKMCGRAACMVRFQGYSR